MILKSDNRPPHFSSGERSRTQEIDLAIFAEIMNLEKKKIGRKEEHSRHHDRHTERGLDANHKVGDHGPRKLELRPVPEVPAGVAKAGPRQRVLRRQIAQVCDYGEGQGVLREHGWRLRKNRRRRRVDLEHAQAPPKSADLKTVSRNQVADPPGTVRAGCDYDHASTPTAKPDGLRDCVAQKLESSRSGRSVDSDAASEKVAASERQSDVLDVSERHVKARIVQTRLAADVGPVGWTQRASENDLSAGSSERGRERVGRVVSPPVVIDVASVSDAGTDIACGQVGLEEEPHVRGSSKVVSTKSIPEEGWRSSVCNDVDRRRNRIRLRETGSVAVKNVVDESRTGASAIGHLELYSAGSQGRSMCGRIEIERSGRQSLLLINGPLRSDHLWLRTTGGIGHSRRGKQCDYSEQCKNVGQKALAIEG